MLISNRVCNLCNNEPNIEITIKDIENVHCLDYCAEMKMDIDWLRFCMPIHSSTANYFLSNFIKKNSHILDTIFLLRSEINSLDVIVCYIPDNNSYAEYRITYQNDSWTGVIRLNSFGDPIKVYSPTLLGFLQALPDFEMCNCLVYGKNIDTFYHLPLPDGSYYHTPNIDDWSRGIRRSNDSLTISQSIFTEDVKPFVLCDQGIEYSVYVPRSMDSYLDKQKFTSKCFGIFYHCILQLEENDRLIFESAIINKQCFVLRRKQIEQTEMLFYHENAINENLIQTIGSEITKIDDTKCCLFTHQSNPGWFIIAVKYSVADKPNLISENEDIAVDEEVYKKPKC